MRTLHSCAHQIATRILSERCAQEVPLHSPGGLLIVLRLDFFLALCALWANRRDELLRRFREEEHPAVMAAWLDHWPAAAFFFLSGGGFRHGQVIGSTSARGEVPKDRPVHLQNVFHTLYHQFAIDANTTTLLDPNGRPQYLVDHRELIHELV